jgi:hypothetical protein
MIDMMNSYAIPRLTAEDHAEMAQNKMRQSSRRNRDVEQIPLVPMFSRYAVTKDIRVAHAENSRDGVACGTPLRDWKPQGNRLTDRQHIWFEHFYDHFPSQPETDYIPSVVPFSRPPRVTDYKNEIEGIWQKWCNSTKPLPNRIRRILETDSRDIDRTPSFDSWEDGEEIYHYLPQTGATYKYYDGGCRSRFEFLYGAPPCRDCDFRRQDPYKGYKTPWTGEEPPIGYDHVDHSGRYDQHEMGAFYRFDHAIQSAVVVANITKFMQASMDTLLVLPIAGTRTGLPPQRLASYAGQIFDNIATCRGNGEHMAGLTAFDDSTSIELELMTRRYKYARLKTDKRPLRCEHGVIAEKGLPVCSLCVGFDFESTGGRAWQYLDAADQFEIQTDEKFIVHHGQSKNPMCGGPLHISFEPAIHCGPKVDAHRPDMANGCECKFSTRYTNVQMSSKDVSGRYQKLAQQDADNSDSMFEPVAERPDGTHGIMEVACAPVTKNWWWPWRNQWLQTLPQERAHKYELILEARAQGWSDAYAVKCGLAVSADALKSMRYDIKRQAEAWFRARVQAGLIHGEDCQVHLDYVSECFDDNLESKSVLLYNLQRYRL